MRDLEALLARAHSEQAQMREFFLTRVERGRTWAANRASAALSLLLNGGITERRDH
jgi:hypothetical protein